MLSRMIHAARPMAIAAGLTVVMGLAPAAEADGTIAEVKALLEADRPVEAKHALTAMRDRMGSLDTPEAVEVLRLLTLADEQIDIMDAAEVDLQEAELFVERGDLVVADQRAERVMRSPRATTDQRRRAAAILDETALLRDQLASTVPAALLQIEADFLAGRMADAKAGISMIKRSGVRLSREDDRMINRYALSLMELDDPAPSNVAMGVVGPSRTAAAAASASASGQSSDDELARFNAQKVLAEAEEAASEGRWAEAVRKLNQATGVYAPYLSTADLARAEQLLQTARARIDASGAGIAETEAEFGSLLFQQVTVEFDNLMQQAEAALNRGDIDEARVKAGEARFTINQGASQGYVPPEEAARRSRMVDEFIDRARAREEQIVRQRVEQEAVQLAEDQRARQAELENQRREKINENLNRLRALQAERRYQEAMFVVEEILTLDPDNATGLLMRDVLDDVIIYEQWQRIHRTKYRSWAQEAVRADEGLIIPEGILNYPDDWPEITVKRGAVQAFTERPENRRVLAALEQRPVPGTFDTTLENALGLVARVTQLEFDVDWESLDRVGISRDDEVSLALREVPARVLLDRLLDKVSPDEFDPGGWAVHDGIVVVAADSQLRKKRFVVIYDIRDLLFEIPDFNTVPALDLDTVLQQSQQGGGGGSSQSIFQDDQDDPGFDPTGTQEQLDELLDIIQTNIDPDGWENGGGDTGIVRTLKGNLVITNTARNHRQIQSLLKQLREVRNIQISVESRFLTVSEDYFEQIGIDIDLYFNGRNNQFEGVEQQLTDLYGAKLFVPGQNLNLYPSDVVVTGGGGGRTGAYTGIVEDPANPGQFAFAGGPTLPPAPFQIPSPSPLSIIPLQQGSLDLINGDGAGFEGIFNATEFANSILGANPALATAFTYLNDIQVDFLLEATQADRRSVSLQAPRLTFTNGRTANIFVVTQTAFVSDLQPVVGTSAVAFDPTLGTVSEGFTLLVQGVVSADRRYVTLAISVGIAQVEGFESTPVVALAGGSGDGAGDPISAESNIQQPILQVSQVNTGVTVPDKGTILLGGQRLTQEIEVETGVPVLSKLPIISRFFTNRAETKEQRTLLILLKPTILIQSELEEEAGGTADGLLSLPFETNF